MGLKFTAAADYTMIGQAAAAARRATSDGGEMEALKRASEVRAAELFVLMYVFHLTTILLYFCEKIL